MWHVSRLTPVQPTSSDESKDIAAIEQIIARSAARHADRIQLRFAVCPLLIRPILAACNFAPQQKGGAKDNFGLQIAARHASRECSVNRCIRATRYAAGYVELRQVRLLDGVRA